MDRIARERVREHRQGRGQGLALAGAHLGDRPRVEDHAADQLDVVVALAEGALARLATERERFGQQVVRRLAVIRAPAQLVGARAGLAVIEQLDLGLVAVDRLDAALVVAELAALVAGPCR